MSRSMNCQSFKAVTFSNKALLSSRCLTSQVPLVCRNCRVYSTTTDRLPRVAQPSIWTSIIPKAFRTWEKPKVSSPKSQKRKEWNPATFYICIFLLIGSNAITLLALRMEYAVFSRKADQKIALLKEVLERVQKGENVDVEKVLGTGDEVKEQEWHDMLRDVEEEDNIWEAKDRRREKRRLKQEQKASAGTPGEPMDSTNNLVGDEQPPETVKKPPKFF